MELITVHQIWYGVTGGPELKIANLVRLLAVILCLSFYFFAFIPFRDFSFLFYGNKES